MVRLNLSTRRSFTRRTRRDLFGSNGLMVAHSESLSSQRTIQRSGLEASNDVSGSAIIPTVDVSQML
jgi:hypothetical protein